MRGLLDELGLQKRHLFAVAVGVVVWLIFVITSAAGWSLWGVNWNFSNPGAFGDAFAPFNTLMATFAAIGAIAAYRMQARELRQAKERQAEQDDIANSDRARALNREYELDKRADRQSFESTFFKLLETFRGIVNATDSGRGEKAVTAQDAFKAIADQLDYFRNFPNGSPEQAWKSVANNHHNDLNHYFRFLYHTILYVHESDIKNKYFYIRLVRALLSESELLLLAVNCQYGDGKEKFLNLVEEYALLHNMTILSRKRWNLDDIYLKTAFERGIDSNEEALTPKMAPSRSK